MIGLQQIREETNEDYKAADGIKPLGLGTEYDYHNGSSDDATVDENYSEADAATGGTSTPTSEGSFCNVKDESHLPQRPSSSPMLAPKMWPMGKWKASSKTTSISTSSSSQTLTLTFSHPSDLDAQQESDGGRVELQEIKSTSQVETKSEYAKDFNAPIHPGLCQLLVDRSVVLLTVLLQVGYLVST